MSDVSIYPTQEPDADLAAIMHGGANFMKRMEAFLLAKDKAEALLRSAQEEASVLHEASIRDRADAIGVIEDAHKQAAHIVEDALKEADETRLKIKADLEHAAKVADQIVEDGKAKAAEITDRARALMDEIRAERETVASLRSDAERVKAEADAKAGEIEGLVSQANAVKEKYAGIIARLTAVMSEELGS